jgi:hypothetical protein
MKRTTEDGRHEIPTVVTLMDLLDEYLKAALARDKAAEKVAELKAEIIALTEELPEPASKPITIESCTCDLMHTSFGCPQHDWRRNADARY